jgi:hypothetical protein
VAKYGLAKYGIDKYGETGLAVYYNSGITAKPIDYNTIFITWGGVTADPADTPPTHWKLVKSFIGDVDNPEDAITVDGDEIGSFRTSIYDSTFSEQQLGMQVTYSLWVYNPTTGWIFSGRADAVVVRDIASLNTISKWIPRAWLNEQNSVGDATGEPEPTNDLVKVLAAYAFQYDTLRTYASILSETSNAKKAHTSLYKNLVEQFGFSYEPALGDSYHSSLYKVGFLVNAFKGTLVGLRSYITALTHLESDIRPGHNILLDVNDSSFEESLGRWTASSGTLTRKTYTNSFTAPSIYVYDTLYPPKTIGYASLTTASSSPVTLLLPGSADNKITYGIPVKPNTRYLVTGWIKHLNNAADVTVKINWYNASGSYISSNTISDTLTTTTSWQEFISKSDGVRDGQASPSKAVYAAIELVIDPSNASSNEYAFDMIQFAEAVNSLEFEDSRLTKIYLKGNTTNYILNPSFEEGTGFWKPINGKLVENANVSSEVLVDDSCVGQIITTSNGVSGVTSDWVSVDGGAPYSFSGYVFGPVGRIARLRMEFSHHPTVPTRNIANITNVTGNGTTLTVTAKNTFAAGQTVVLSDITPTNFNVTGTIASATSYSFTLANAATGTYVSGGEAETTYTSASAVETDVNGEFYSSVLYYVESDPITLNGNLQRLTAVGTPPLYDKDAGSPLVKCSLYIENALANDVYYVDAFSLQEGDTELPYFSGSGGVLPDDPIVEKYFYIGDCTWEKEPRFNYVKNSSLENTTGWSTSSSTLTSETPSGYSALFGAKSGKVAYTTSGSIYITVDLPFAATGGEDVVVSAYVRGAFATYDIKTNDGGTLPTSSSFTIADDDKDQWIRIHNVRKLDAGETSFTLKITVTNETGSTDTFFHVDGVQAELGLMPTKFIDPAQNLIVREVPNPGNTSVNMFTTEEPSIGGGKSIYISNYDVKNLRLDDTLDTIMPDSSAWKINPGVPRIQYPELTESLIPSASFERDLGDWQAKDSTLARVVSGGSLLNDYTAHGQAYCLVTTTHGSGDPSFFFGLESDKIYIRSGSGYYGSVAVRPANSNSLGTYEIKVTFYDADDSVHQYTPTGGSPTNAIFFHTQNVTLATRWAYLSIVAPGYTTSGAEYAIYEVNYKPVTFNASHAFHVDRAVFRE